MCTSTGMTASLRILSSKANSNTWERFTRSELKLESVHQESPRSTSSGKGLPSHFWTRNIIRSILPGLRRKRTGLLLSGSKSSFQMKVNFAFNLEIKVPESGGRLGTCPHCQRYQKLVQWPWCYCAWLARKLAWPEPQRESMEDERHQTQQCRWPEDRYQSTLGFITPEQCHRRIASMPRRIDAVIHAKGGQTKYWVHRN